MSKLKPSGYIQLDGSDFVYGDRIYKVVYVNERLLKNGWPRDGAGYSVEGNCLSPEVVPGDIMILVHDEAPQCGDIVEIFRGDKGPFLQCYREPCNSVRTAVAFLRDEFTYAYQKAGLLRIV